MYELQHEIELTYGKQNIRKQVIEDIDQESIVILEILKKIQEYRYKQYSYASKNKRVSSLKISSQKLAIEIAIAVVTIEEVVTPIQVVIGKLIPHLGYVNDLDGIKTAGELLAVCEGDLYSLYHSTDFENTTDTLGIKPKYQLSDSTRQFIKNTKYLPPMLCKPITWKGIYGSGNLTGSGSLILGNGNDVGQYQNLDAINTLQDIKWELNEEVLEFMEESKKVLDTHEKKVNFNRMVNSSEKVYQDLLDQGNEFYFVWKYDFRGRSYCMGYHVSVQSSSYKKAILNFKHKELLTEEIIV